MLTPVATETTQSGIAIGSLGSALAGLAFALGLNDCFSGPCASRAPIRVGYGGDELHDPLPNSIGREIWTVAASQLAPH